VSVLAILEQREGAWHRMSFETLAAAQQLGAQAGEGVVAAVLGRGIEALGAELAGKRLERAIVVDHELLREYTADGYTLALRQLIEAVQPSMVLFPHTYRTRDYMPKLATSFGREAASDAVAFRVEAGKPVIVRQLFQGKVNADFRPVGHGPHFASLQAGAWRADRVEEGSAPVETFTPRLAAADIRVKPLEVFRESRRLVDLSAAAAIVAVGRGIREAGNIPMARKLADALGAELAASRPICDAGWMAMDRQVGSSGQTVAPKLYVALGVSGAIQHLVGMRASKVVVAINKDPEAPIFEVADYGIVGDLFEVVPAMVEEIRKAGS
jgi:electron transfer flavoprotein alpha subunit